MPLKRLIWKQEEKLYSPLQLAYGSSRVFAKVRMVDVIAAEDPNLTYEEKGYLFKAHFDFVIVNEKYEPVVAFELDGSHHLFDKKQIERDEKKDAISEKARLPLIRIPLEVVNKMKDVSEVFAKAGYSERGGEKEILADLVRGLHEVETNPEFKKFTDWLIAQEHSRNILLNYSFSEFVELVHRDGLQGAISNIETVISVSDFFDETFEKSGFSREEWEGFGFSAVYCLIPFSIERAKTLGMTPENYHKTTEGMRLQFAARRIATKGEEDCSPADWFAFFEETSKVSMEVLSSLARIRQNHSAVTEQFLADIRSLAEFIGASDEENINRQREFFSVLADYLAQVRLHAERENT